LFECSRARARARGRGDRVGGRVGSGFPGLLAALALVVLLPGCARLHRNPGPLNLSGTASIPYLPEVRAWAGQPSPAMEAGLARTEVFDPVLMRRLYAVGCEHALAGPVWNTRPPGLLP
jgi:hypothetical protein